MTLNKGLVKEYHLLNTAQKNIATTHQAWLLDDGQGNFTGAVIPMTAPLEAMTQWQSALDTIFAEAVTVDPQANIDGLYSITFHSDSTTSGLLISRLRPNILEGYDSVIPHGSLGLVAVTTEPQTQSRIAICALTGGVTAAGTIKPNRTLCSFVSATGTSEKPALTRGEVLAIRAIGKFLHGRIDKHLETTRG